MIQLKSIEDFKKAVDIIETWHKEQPKKVTFVGEKKIDPILTKPYTKYLEEELRILDDSIVRQLLDAEGLEYDIVTEKA